MSPDKKQQDNPDKLQRKGKPAITHSKCHTSKAQPELDSSTPPTTGNLPGDAASISKTKTAFAQPDNTQVATKETAATETTTGQPVPVNEADQPLPVFLSLPLLEPLGACNVGIENQSSPAGIPPTQSAQGTDPTKVLPTIATGMAATVVGKSSAAAQTSGKVQPEQSTENITADKTAAGALVAGDKISLEDSQKLSPEIINPATMTDEAKPSPTVQNGTTDGKMAAIPISAAGASAEPIQTRKIAVAHPDATSPDLGANAPVGTNDNLQTALPVNGKLGDPSRNDGTGVAITASSMKNSDKTNKVAGLDVQVLPGGTNGTARETVLPVHATVTAVRSSEKQNSDLNLPIPTANPAITDNLETANTVALPSLTDARMRDVERTHDLVSIHALRMVESKSDSLQVVIKPGAGTELSLELRHRNGNIEAEAILQRGDYQLMNQHWPELQQKLEQRGIKLAPLGSETNFTATGNNNGTGNFSRQQSSREEAAQQASAFAEFTVAMNRGGATARLAPAIAGGWESWA